METHTIPSPHPTHQLHPKTCHTPPLHTTTGTHPRKYNLNIYIANSKALTLLNPHSIQQSMNIALTQAYGYTVQTTLLDTNTTYACNIDITTSYADIPTPLQPHYTTTILNTKPHNRKWNPKDFVYTDGSQVKGNNTLGAGVVNPRTGHVTHVEIKSQNEKHTINRAELAAITTALRTENT
jgi:hypothetical protein